MRLLSFQIKYYKSIVDTGEVILSSYDNISILAGQNESGKSSILEALQDYEKNEFNPDSKPFSIKGNPVQSVSCTYIISDSDGFIVDFSENFAKEFNLNLEDGTEIFNTQKLNSIKKFTLTRSKSKEGETSLSLNSPVFEIIKASLLDKKVETEVKQEDGSVKKEITKQKILELSEDDNSKIAEILWTLAPKVILFNDFCDLLPDKITLADLKTKNADAKGYRAVKNLEKILDVNFIDLYSKDDLEREALRDEHNDQISVNFREAWGQKIHNDNKVEVKYDFEKRSSDDNSYVNFYLETKDRQKIKPRLRSKGLVWFLSFWLELNAQNADDDKLIILADEPGLYLHIKAQSDILKLFEKLKNDGHQIIYTTHSPNLIETKHLNRISLVLNDSDKGTILESITTAKIDSENKKDALQPIAHAIGLEISDFSEIGKKNVILEGLSDFYYFLAMHKLLRRKEGYNFLPGIGIRKVENLISLCIGHGFDWLVIMDDDPVKGGKDSMTKFDEIKEHVFDDDENKTNKKVYVLSKITGVENMFTIGDLKLVDSKITPKKDLSQSVGKNRKILFAKLFFEKTQSKEIKADQLSEQSKANFKKVFDFIDTHFD